MSYPLFRVRKDGKIIDFEEIRFVPSHVLPPETYAVITYKDQCGKFVVMAPQFVQIELWSGLVDKNGTKIFEGDAFRWHRYTFTIRVDWFHGLRFMFGQDMLDRALAMHGEVVPVDSERKSL